MSKHGHPQQGPDVTAFTIAYVEAALWSSTDNADESGGEPLDANYGPMDIDEGTMEAIRADCADFVHRYGRLIEDDDSREISKYGEWSLAGHKFWLSRNGHGASFQDGDWPKHGDELQKAAESYGEFDLYVGDDGKVHGSPLTPRRKRLNEVAERRDPTTGQFAVGPDPVGEWAVVQRMMKVYAEAKGLGDYVHNSAIPTGRPGEWRFWAQKPGERSKEHQVSTQHLKNAYERGGLSEHRPTAEHHRRRSVAHWRGHAAPRVRDYDVTDNRGKLEEARKRPFRLVALRLAGDGYGSKNKEVLSTFSTESAAKKALDERYPRYMWESWNLYDVWIEGLNRMSGRFERLNEPRGLSEQTRVRDYDVTDNRGKRLAGPFKDYGQARSEADSRGGVVGFVAGERGGHKVGCPMRAVAAPRQHRGGYRAEASRRASRKHTAARRSPDTWKTAGAGAMAIAAELSRRVGGTGPKAIPDGFRWSDKNESASFTTYSPQHSQKVVVVVSVFEKDGTLALNFFSDESLSATAQYENIGHNLYSTVDFGEMVADLKWVWETVDEYAESWGAGHDEVDEASRVSRVSERRPTRPTRRNPVNASRHPRAGVRAVHPRHQHSVLSRHGSKMIAAEARGQRRAREGVDAEEAGERYAKEQVQSDHFNQWVYGQMVEGRRMRKADPKSVIPLESAADYKRLARNILQQLGWDMDRDMDMRAILDVVGVDSEGTTQDAEVAREFAKGVRTMLFKPSTINSLASDLRRVETELKRAERGAKGGGRKRASESAQTTRLLPPALNRS